MIGDLDLAIQRAEHASLMTLHNAASDDLRDRLGLELVELDGAATLSMARRHPTILINRVLGLGTETPATRDQVETIRDRFAKAGIGRYFLHLHRDAEPAELGPWLEAAGLFRARGWMQFLRETDDPPEARTDLDIREIGPENAKDFARIACPAFDLDDAYVPLVARLVGQPNCHVFMSFDGERPAGTGLLFVHGEVAWCDWGATSPDFRRRGSQSALLAHRVRMAGELGARVVGTETGEAVTGDPQHSYNNILRQGFRQLGLRPNYAPA